MTVTETSSVFALILRPLPATAFPPMALKERRFWGMYPLFVLVSFTIPEIFVAKFVFVFVFVFKNISHAARLLIKIRRRLTKSKSWWNYSP